jgi:2,4-dienoyl-CoA reductase-like NADH-dependent reductase (Old Yellow Enzyme family)
MILKERRCECLYRTSLQHLREERKGWNILMAYELLMQPLTVKGTTFPNRIVFPPVQTNYATEDGEATERLIRFHRTIAKNNVGLSIVGATGISASSRLGSHALCLYEDRHIASAQKLFSAIKGAGSVPAVQLNHGGRVMSSVLAGGDVVGPSAIASPAAGVTPRELTREEIEEIIGQFVRAAEGAKNAGATVVEFHGAHSFLLNQFMSPAANHRSDHYGGSTENRARIVRNILERTRERVGKDFVLGLRMSVEEYTDGGLTVEESRKLVKLFVESGLDIIHVSAGGIDTGPQMLQEAAQGNIVRLAGKIKKHVDIPVIAVGGILRLEQAERVLEQNVADMVAIGRALIADQELVSKSIEDKPETVIECTGCLQCFMEGEEPGLTCPENENL